MCHRRRIVTYIAILVISVNWPIKASGKNLSVAASLKAQEMYDTNPLLGAESGNIQGEYLTLITPKIELQGDFKKVKIKGDYTLTSINYSRSYQRNSANHVANLSMDANLSERTLVSAKETISLRTNDPIIFGASQRSFAQTNDVIQTYLTNTFSNVASIAVTHSLSGNTSLALTVFESIYEREGSSLLDSKYDSAELAGRYSFSNKIGMDIKYGYGYASMTTGSGNSTVADSNSPLDIASDININTGSSNAENHYGLIGLFGQIFSRTTISIDAGGNYIPNSSTGKGGVAFISHGEIKSDFQRSNVNLTYSRDVSMTNSFIATPLIRDMASLSWNINLGKTLKSTISGQYSSIEQAVASQNVIKIDSYRVGITGGWDIMSWLETGLGFSYYEQVIGGDSLGEPVSKEIAYLFFKTALKHKGRRH